MTSSTRTSTLLSQSPQAFVAFLKEKGIKGCHFTYDPKTDSVTASHPELAPIAEFMSRDTRDFQKHEGIFLKVSDEYDTLLGAFIHKTCRGQGAGGLRYWGYDTLEGFLRDGLRLSKGMTRKNALAGLWWGGGKGILAHNPSVDKKDPAVRESLFKNYGRFMTALKGCYLTAEDVGCNVSNINHVFSETRFVTCVPPEKGGSGNPSIATARGVVRAMESAMEALGTGNLEGKTVVIQGAGNVGRPIVGFLLEKGVKHIVVSDIFGENLEMCGQSYPDDRVEFLKADKGDNNILATPCDILAPCATGGILNPTTIPTLKAKLICGAANNQLEDSIRDGRLLFDAGITYLPDFMVNRMGIVNCANEQYGYVNGDEHIEKHLSRDWKHSIHQSTLRIIEEAKSQNRPTIEIALELADELSKELHPIFGHRGISIIQSVTSGEWAETK